MLPSYFVLVGTGIGCVGSVAYIVDTVRGRIRPNRVSFFLWSIAPLIAFGAQVGQGGGLEALLTFSMGFLPLTILIASFTNKEAEWKLTRFDALCGLLSLVGLALWLVTKIGNIAIFFSIVADGLAAIPTMVKSYKYPHTERAWPWLTAPIGVILTLLTLKEVTFANAGFIIYVLVVNTIIFSLIQFRVGARTRA